MTVISNPITATKATVGRRLSLFIVPTNSHYQAFPLAYPSSQCTHPAIYRTRATFLPFLPILPSVEQVPDNRNEELLGSQEGL